MVRPLSIRAELEATIAKLQGEISKLRDIAQPSTAVTLHEWFAAPFAPPNGHASKVQTRLYAALQEVCVL